MKKLFSLALVALVSVALASCGKSEAGEVALKGFKAMTDGSDPTQYLDPNTKNLEDFRKASKEGAQNMKNLGITYEDIKLVGVEENGDKATAKISMTATGFGETTTDTTEVPLVKVEGKWYISTSESK